MDDKTVKSGGGCPVMHGANRNTRVSARSNREWWPNQLNLKILHQDNVALNPLGEAFDYAEEFKKLDLEAVKADLRKVMTDYLNTGSDFARSLSRPELKLPVPIRSN